MHLSRGDVGEDFTVADAERIRKGTGEADRATGAEWEIGRCGAGPRDAQHLGWWKLSETLGKVHRNL